MSKLDASIDQTLRVLILTDGKMGDLAQCRGVAHALGAITNEIVVKPGALAALVGSTTTDTGFKDHLASMDRAPHIVLASGRRTLPYLKAAKSKWRDQTLTAFLKDPRTGSEVADLIWVPTHDRLRGDNVIVTDTGPHTQTLEKRDQEAGRLVSELTEDGFTVSHPWLGVLLGGATKKVRYEQATVSRFLQALEIASTHAAGVLVTPSRRTPPALIEAVKRAHPHVWIWDGKGKNPYSGILGTCDAFLVTGDSHNMVSEALATGKQVMVFRPSGLPKKFASFLDKLAESDYIFEPIATDFAQAQEPIDATPVIAAHILERLKADAKTS